MYGCIYAYMYIVTTVCSLRFIDSKFCIYNNKNSI
jgi:hypothetical protein